MWHYLLFHVACSSFSTKSICRKMDVKLFSHIDTSVISFLKVIDTIYPECGIYMMKLNSRFNKISIRLSSIFLRKETHQ